MSQGFFIAHRATPAPKVHAEPPPARARSDRPLMADIARLAGVSIATVSRALRGDRMVAAHTRARIAGIAQSLHYGVDVRARGLRLGQIDAVSVVVPKGPHPGPSLADPFILELLGSIADALADRGRPMLLSRPAMLQPEVLACDVETGRAGGLLIIGQGQHHAQLQAMAARGVPFVVWGAQLEGQRYTSVGGDNLVGGRLAIGHLLDRGARRVAFVGDTRQPEMALRHAGYLQAHRARGVQPLTGVPTPWHLAVDDPAQHVAQALQHMQAPDAVFAGSDLLAMAAVHRLRQAGRRVPEDVLVAGFDNTAMAAQFHPPLTTVCPSTAAAGPALLQALDAVAAGGIGQAGASVLLPTRLQVRPSSAAGLRG